MPQLESYTTAVEMSISLNPWERMSIRGRLKTIGQIHLGCFDNTNLYLLHISLTSEKDLHALSLTNAPYSCQSMWEKKRKKAGNVISLI